ncbi:hypothetical protein D3C74_438570 [compost metagenome]
MATTGKINESRVNHFNTLFMRSTSLLGAARHHQAELPVIGFFWQHLANDLAFIDDSNSVRYIDNLIQFK